MFGDERDPSEPRDRSNRELPIRLSTDNEDQANPLRITTPTAAADITPQSILDPDDFLKKKTRTVWLSEDIEFPPTQPSCLIIRCSHDGFSFRRADITKLKTITLKPPRRRAQLGSRLFPLQSEGSPPAELQNQRISERRYDIAQDLLHKFVRKLNEKIFDVYHKRRNNEQRNYFEEYRPHLVGLALIMSLGVVFLVSAELVDGEVDDPVTHDPIGKRWTLMLLGILTLVFGTLLSILLSFWIVGISGNSSETLDNLIVKLVDSEVNKFNQEQEVEQWKVDEDEPDLPKEQRPLALKMSTGLCALWLQVDIS